MTDYNSLRRLSVRDDAHLNVEWLPYAIERCGAGSFGIARDGPDKGLQCTCSPEMERPVTWEGESSPCEGGVQNGDTIEYTEWIEPWTYTVSPDTLLGCSGGAFMSEQNNGGVPARQVAAEPAGTYSGGSNISCTIPGQWSGGCEEIHVTNLQARRSPEGDRPGAISRGQRANSGPAVRADVGLYGKGYSPDVHQCNAYQDANLLELGKCLPCQPAAPEGSTMAGCECPLAVAVDIFR